MIFRPALSAPLPWLLLPIHRLFGRRAQGVGRKRFFRLPRTLSFTREGKLFTLALLLIGVAAINTGNNLLYLVDSMLLSLIIISGIMSESTVRRLFIERGMPRHIYAGRPTLIPWRFENRKGRRASYSFVVEELPVDGVATEDIYTVKLPPQGSLTRSVLYTFRYRGIYRLNGFRISTHFPFGLFRKGRPVHVEQEVVVFPKVRALRRRPITSSSTGERLQRRRGMGTHPYTLRDYTTYDDARLIHWKSTAKASKVVAREFEREGGGRVCIIIDNYGEEGRDERLEGIIEEAASLANHFIKRGYSVGMRSLEGEVQCQGGTNHLYGLLKALAILQPKGGGEKSPSLKVVGA